MNAKAAHERQRDYYERMKAQGLKKVCVYVRDEDKHKVQALARELRDAVENKPGRKS